MSDTTGTSDQGGYRPGSTFTRHDYMQLVEKRNAARRAYTEAQDGAVTTALLLGDHVAEGREIPPLLAARYRVERAKAGVLCDAWLEARAEVEKASHAVDRLRLVKP